MAGMADSMRSSQVEPAASTAHFAMTDQSCFNGFLAFVAYATHEVDSPIGFSIVCDKEPSVGPKRESRVKNYDD